MPDAAPRYAVDGHVLLFTLGVTVLAGLFFGPAPAFKISQSPIQETLRESGRGVSGSRQRLQGVFVVAEMAIALVLLFGAGLMIRSLTQLWRVDPGFHPHNVVTFRFSVAPSLVSNPAQSPRSRASKPFRWRAARCRWRATPSCPSGWKARRGR
jgi:hypothetical protein